MDLADVAMDAATTAVSGSFYCYSAAVAVATASDLTTTVADANLSAKGGPLNEVPFLCHIVDCFLLVRSASSFLLPFFSYILHLFHILHFRQWLIFPCWYQILSCSCFFFCFYISASIFCLFFSFSFWDKNFLSSDKKVLHFIICAKVIFSAVLS